MSRLRRDSAPALVILTGAGISAESGLRTFRDQNGLWEEHRIEEVATPEGFERNPALVDRFYNERRRLLPETHPNAAHRALADLERAWPGPFLLITQNVDDLHERAGSKTLLHMHGELLKARCRHCLQVHVWHADLLRSTACPGCARAGGLRPHVVWFGEMPLHMAEINDRLSTCAIFVAVGTSGQVYPAAGFVQTTPAHCRRIEVNAADTAVSRAFTEHRIGPATKEVPRLAEELLRLRS